MATYLLKSRSTTHMMMNMRPRPTSTPIMVGSANAPMAGLSVPATTRRQFLKKFKKTQRQKIRHQTELDACKRDAVRIGRKDGAAVDTPKKRRARPSFISKSDPCRLLGWPKTQTKSLSTSSALNHSSTDKMSVGHCNIRCFGHISTRRQMTQRHKVQVKQKTRRRLICTQS